MPIAVSASGVIVAKAAWLPW